MPAGRRSGPDPMEKLMAAVEERINAALDSRDRRVKEENDPWARFEGTLSRMLDERFDALAKALGDGVEEGKRLEGPPAGRAEDDGEEPSGGKKLLHDLGLWGG